MAIDPKAMIAEVRENQAALAACPGPHDFSIDVDPKRTIFKRWQCSRCGGRIDASDRRWYELGLAHGRGTKAAS